MIPAKIADLAEAKRGLDEDIAGTKGAPGFLGAYFVPVDDSHGVSIERFETDEQAPATGPSKGAEAPGVTVDTIQLGAVTGSV
jgi:hypothetical protein